MTVIHPFPSRAEMKTTGIPVICKIKGILTLQFTIRPIIKTNAMTGKKEWQMQCVG